MSRFYSYNRPFFLNFIFRLTPAAWTDDRFYNVTMTQYDVLPRNEMPFEGRVDTAPHLGGPIPKSHFGGVNMRFQAKLAKY